MDATRTIVKKNHIKENPEATKVKINRVIANVHSNLMMGLSLYRFNGKRLSLSLEDSWKNQAYSILESFIFTEQKDYDKLENDLDIVLSEVKNKFEVGLN